MSENQKPKYYITTAIAYTSGKPHIGNTYRDRSWRTRLRVIREARDTTYFSRPEQTSMDRRLS